MERRCYTSKQYSTRESLEISVILASVADYGLESKVLEILEEIVFPINPSLVEEYHRLPSKRLAKENHHKDVRTFVESC